MERVLIVDDEKGVRASLQAILSDEGLEADAVATGEEGLELLSKREYGAVLLDVWLPRIDGIEVLASIGRGPGRPAVIMISGHGSIETAVRATKMGAFDFLEKPLSLEKVVLVVSNGLKQRRLEDQNRMLRSEVAGADWIVGDGESARRLRREIAALASGSGPVLLRGEIGSGKELTARLMHAAGARNEEPFVVLHCAGLPEDRLAAELFGSERCGVADSEDVPRGKLELAHGGTVFLDDVERIPRTIQPQLIALLDRGELTRPGDDAPKRADVRVLAGTRVSLKDEVDGGRMLPEMQEHLSASVLEVPALRDRREDIPALAQHFLERFCRHYGGGPLEFAPQALEVLGGHDWPGNARELRNVVERIVITARGERVGREDLPPSLGGTGADDDPFAAGRSFREGREIFERQFIHRRLTENDFNVTRTAKVLGLERSHLHRKIKALGLD